MSFITPEFLIRSLQNLVNRQEEMQTVALYLRSNKSEHELITEIFSRELTASNLYHRLNLFYLANEILQTEKSKDEEAVALIAGLKRIIPSIFIDSISRSNEMLKKKYISLGKVWIERRIFDAKQLGPELYKSADDTEFSRDEVIKRINRYFDERDSLLKYLKEFMKRIEDK